MFEKAYQELHDSIAPQPVLVAQTKEKMMEMLDISAKHAVHRPHKKMVLILLLALALLGATAFALTQPMMVDWFGNKAAVDEGIWSEDVPMTAEETAVAKEIERRAHIAQKWIADAPDDELWVAEIYDESQVYHPIISRTAAPGHASFVQMKDQIKAADNELLVPSFIPDGYTFKAGQFNYYATNVQEAAGYELFSEEADTNGIVYKKYRPLALNESNIERFTMKFEDTQGSMITLRCFREEMNERGFFNIEEGKTCEAVSIKGMAKALYICSNDPGSPSELALRKENMVPKAYVQFSAQAAEYEPLEIGPVTTFYYNAATYTIEADHLDKETLIIIAESLQ